MAKPGSEDFLKEVGINIRRTRESKGMTMEELANASQIEYRQLGRIERGEINTGIISLHKLAQTLNVNEGVFFVRDGQN